MSDLSLMAGSTKPLSTGGGGLADCGIHPDAVTPQSSSVDTTKTDDTTPKSVVGQQCSDRSEMMSTKTESDDLSEPFDVISLLNSGQTLRLLLSLAE